MAKKLTKPQQAVLDAMKDGFSLISTGGRPALIRRLEARKVTTQTLWKLFEGGHIVKRADSTENWQVFELAKRQS